MKLHQQIKSLQQKLRNRLIEMYLSGSYSHEQVAEEVGHNYQAVRWFYDRWKDEYDFPMAQPGSVGISKKGRKSALSANLAQAHKEHMEGDTLAQIGKRYGDIGRETVRQKFKREGLKTRDERSRKRNKNSF